jgi:hypothetical protein
MLRDFNDTHCGLGAMNVRDRLDVAENAVEVDGCGAKHVYVCIQEVTEQRRRSVRTRFSCTQREETGQSDFLRRTNKAGEYVAANKRSPPTC